VKYEGIELKLRTRSERLSKTPVPSEEEVQTPAYLKNYTT
jgi:hypothetical protein